MLSRLVKAVVIAAVMALVIESLPDIKRYLELREMLRPRTPERRAATRHRHSTA